MNVMVETEHVLIPPDHRQFGKVVDSATVNQLPSPRSYDLKLELMPNASLPPTLSIYRLTLPEERVLEDWIDDQLSKGFIRPSRSPISAPIFFVGKKDGGLRPCIDYRKLNEVTVKDKFPLPLIDDLLDQLSTGKYFTCLDLQNAYNLVRIREGDEWMASFRCKFWQFEPLVMQFGLVNSRFRDSWTPSSLIC
jgi:hypothetical protein